MQDKANGSRQRAPDDRLRVPIWDAIEDRWWARRKCAFARPTIVALSENQTKETTSSPQNGCRTNSTTRSGPTPRPDYWRWAPGVRAEPGGRGRAGLAGGWRA